MPKATVYNFKEGKKAKDLTLEKSIFNIEVKKEVLHKAINVQLSNRRENIAKTKDRSEVRGGGAKPWKQKGTGRARHGSTRSPIWIGGGVTFGPTNNRNFKRKINKKEKTKALLMALSDRANEKKIIILDDIKLDKISTKSFASKIKKLPVKDEKALLVISKKDSKITKSSANLPNIKTINISNLNIYDILNYEYLMLSKDALENMQKNYK